MSKDEITESRPKVLITGGSGTVGQAFIKEYRDEFEFHSLSRDGTHMQELVAKFPEVKTYLSDIQDLDHLSTLIIKIKPDVVIHAAALKYIDFAELNPSRTVEINILGSLNVAKACSRADVPIVVGVSTDKACQPESIYGYSKKIMEQMFCDQYTSQSKFVCARFANVACSNGSVIPRWIDCAKRNEPLKLTDSRMNRLMFTREDSARLIKQCIDYAELSTKPFVLSTRMKSVGLLDLAHQISSEFGDNEKPEIVGMRPGEKLNETLISSAELNDAYYTDNGPYIMLHSNEFGTARVPEPLSSLTGDYMNEDEMRALYASYIESSD